MSKPSVPHEANFMVATAIKCVVTAYHRNGDVTVEFPQVIRINGCTAKVFRMPRDLVESCEKYARHAMRAKPLGSFTTESLGTQIPAVAALLGMRPSRPL